MAEPPDPVALTAELVRRASVTPDAAAAIDIVANSLTPFGFRVTRIDRGGVANLFARRGAGGPVLGFNGHVDVVPPGDAASWTHPPFSAAISDGALWGRGAVDMKSGVAAFVAAACRWAARGAPGGSVALLVTGDEEGPARDGTRAILDWMAANGERLDGCVVGEPTSTDAVGDAIKIGRRGSMTARITARGTQGHTAYPHRARNPLPALARLLDGLASAPLDGGTDAFEPSTLQITTIDVGNPVNNVIPAEGRATVNLRFNDRHDGASLSAMLRARAAGTAAAFGVDIEVETEISGEAFLTAPGPLVEAVSGAIARVTGRRPALSTGGGASDARFLKDHCPVVEAGLAGHGMHAVDERTPVGDIVSLTDVYEAIIDDYMKSVS